MILDEIVVLLLLAILIAATSYIVYRRVKLANRGPPKTVAIKRGNIENDESVSEHKKKQVVGMINCEYCGNLMSQNITVCPNCGAPRNE